MPWTRQTDISEDDGVFPNDWISSYNERALLGRILYDPDTQRPKHVKNVTFFTKDQYSGTACNCYHEIVSNLDDFYSRLKFNSHFENFDKIDIRSEYWDRINRWIELSEFKYQDIDMVKHWTSTALDLNNTENAEIFQKLTIEQKIYLSAFKGALRCDMKNGQANMWIEELIKTLVKCLKDSKLADPDLYLNIWSPAHYCNTNTTIETIAGDLRNPTTQILYNAPFSLDSSAEDQHLPSLSNYVSTNSEASSSSTHSSTLSHDSRVKKQTVVPDVCVALTSFPGVFQIVFELKPAWKESEGYDQNIKQMISKLFFQDVIFGVVISSRQYQLSVITKHQGEVHILSTATISLYTWKDEGYWGLNIAAFNKLYSFIYQALKWSIKSNCLLETTNQP